MGNPPSPPMVWPSEIKPQVLKCAYCGRDYPSEKPEHCVGCGAPLQGKSTKEQYEEAFYRNAMIPSVILETRLSRSFYSPQSTEHQAKVDAERVLDTFTGFGLLCLVVLIFTLFIMHMAGIL